ncbi:TPA: hypothetical protein ISB64_004681 [Escherichia coli]|nr:hypothetical protein [Escherichia coli]
MLGIFSNIATIIGLVVGILSLLYNFSSQDANQYKVKDNIKIIGRTLIQNALVLSIVYLILLMIYIILIFLIHGEEIFYSILFIIGTTLGLVSFIIYILNERNIQKNGVRIRNEIIEKKEANEYINTKSQLELNKACKELNESNDEGDIEEEINSLKKLEKNRMKYSKRVNRCFFRAKIGYFFMPLILFSYIELLSQNNNITNFVIILIIVFAYIFNFFIIYPKIKLENGYINITPAMVSMHIKEFEKIHRNRKIEKNT